MAVLQMRDLPDELYEKLKAKAKAERRSIMQQALVILENALNHDEQMTRRQQAVRKMMGLKVDLSDKLDIVNLVREDRER